jgi:hypothetical protein
VSERLSEEQKKSICIITEAQGDQKKSSDAAAAMIIFVWVVHAHPVKSSHLDVLHLYCTDHVTKTNHVSDGTRVATAYTDEDQEKAQSVTVYYQSQARVHSMQT